MALIAISNLCCFTKLREPCKVIRYSASERLGNLDDAFLGGGMFIKVIGPCLSRFKMGFESEPTLHSGINYAVLLLAAGHQFETSFELRKVGE